MANLFINVPSQAGNGAGAAVDVSAYGAGKTIVVEDVSNWLRRLESRRAMTYAF